MVKACSEEDVDIQDGGMVNVEKKVGVKDLDGDDSTTEESISQSEAYPIERGENDEPSEETTTKVISRRMKRKQIDSSFFDGEGAIHNQNTKGPQSTRGTEGCMGKKHLVPILSTTELILTPGHVTKGM